MLAGRPSSTCVTYASEALTRVLEKTPLSQIPAASRGPLLAGVREELMSMVSPEYILIIRPFYKLVPCI